MMNYLRAGFFATLGVFLSLLFVGLVLILIAIIGSMFNKKED